MIVCDLGICVGCRMCEVTCSSFHFEAVSPALARIRVAKLEEIGIEMAVACLGCLEKPCLECPTEALSVGERGVIVLAADLCSGCQECVGNCPVGAVGFHDDLPLFCDLCAGATSCVETCPTGALSNREGQQPSLEDFLSSPGGSGRRRARFVEVQGEPLRRAWARGVRVDS